MGCGASGCKKDDRRSGDRIEYDMDTLNIGEFDSMFKDVRDLLSVFEDARAGLKETVEDIKEMCEVERLKNPSFDECIKVWMWSISANNGGQIGKAGFNIIGDAPYFEVNCSGCTWEAWWIQDYFTKFVKTAVDMPQKCADAVSALGGLAEKCMSLDPAGAIEGSDLDLLDKARAVKAFAVNAKRTATGLVRAKEIIVAIGEGAVIVKSMATNMKTWVTECDIYGKKAFDKACWRPSQILRDIHPGPHKTADEMKAYEEVVLRNKCGCPKCLKELQEQALKDKK